MFNSFSTLLEIDVMSKALTMDNLIEKLQEIRRLNPHMGGAAIMVQDTNGKLVPATIFVNTNEGGDVAIIE